MSEKERVSYAERYLNRDKFCLRRDIINTTIGMYKKHFTVDSKQEA